MAPAGGGQVELNLEYTPTWIVALVCSVIVLISFIVERFIHFLGKYFKRKKQKALYGSLEKLKQELMLVGFISLLLVVLQGALVKICIPESFTHYMLPCKRKVVAPADAEGTTPAVHYSTAYFGGGRRLLAVAGESDVCTKKGKVPLISIEALHQLHIFIFILAVTHVAFTVLTMVLGSLKIYQYWRRWEEAIQNETIRASSIRITDINQFDFIKKRYQGFGKDSQILSWVESFFKQFYGSVTELDYTTMRLGFIMQHCRGNRKFNFYRYMVRALEDDFEQIVGISWYCWIFLMVFLLLNYPGWHVYFWLSFIPLLLLLAVGTKLEHVIVQLAHEVAEKHSAIQGSLVVTPSDDHFWFSKPHIILYLIHFILFQNAFELAIFFWMLFMYGFRSCIMGQVGYVIPRLVIVVVVQLLCSYSTFPLYAIVTQMGSSYKRAIFEHNVQEGISVWAKKVKKRRGMRVTESEPMAIDEGLEEGSESPMEIQLQERFDIENAGRIEEGSARLIVGSSRS